MEGQRFIKDQRVVTPDGPGKVDGYGYPAGANQMPTSIWVFLDSGNFRGYGLDAGVHPEPGSPEPTPLELAVSEVIGQMREQASYQNGKFWVEDVATAEAAAPFQFAINQLAIAYGESPVWEFSVYQGDDENI